MTNEIERIVTETGFVICEFDPSNQDICEHCLEYNHQLYYRRTDYWVDEGEYFCLECILSHYHIQQEEIIEIESLMETHDGWTNSST